MKINWKVRFKNRVWLLTFLMAIIAVAYQICGMFGITPPVSESQITQLISLLVNLLVTLGVLVDPTTKGVNDSNQAMSYIEPK